eukprot:3773465-Pyramimonas_sp.AAC.1
MSNQSMVHMKLHILCARLSSCSAMGIRLQLDLHKRSSKTLSKFQRSARPSMATDISFLLKGKYKVGRLTAHEVQHCAAEEKNGHDDIARCGHRGTRKPNTSIDLMR